MQETFTVELTEVDADTIRADLVWTLTDQDGPVEKRQSEYVDYKHFSVQGLDIQDVYAWADQRAKEKPKSKAAAFLLENGTLHELVVDAAVDSPKEIS